MALKPAQTKLLQAILDPANRSLGDAAKAAGVPHRTAQTWMNRPDFRAELDRIEGDALDGVALDEDPIVFATRDRITWGIALLTLGILMMASRGPFGIPGLME